MVQFGVLSWLNAGPNAATVQDVVGEAWRCGSGGFDTHHCINRTSHVLGQKMVQKSMVRLPNFADGF